MKRKSIIALAGTVLAVGLWTGVAPAKGAGTTDAPKNQSAGKTVTGKSGCATCDGVTTEGHNILLTAKDGTRWVLLGSGPSYEAVHSVRFDGKKITATLAGEPVVKKDSEGKEYKEVKVSDVKIDS